MFQGKTAYSIKNLLKVIAVINSISDPSVHKFFFSLLSQFRTNNRFERTKYLVELLSKGFIILLDNAEKNKLYDNVKNSIILAQTFYYPDENKFYSFFKNTDSNWYFFNGEKINQYNNESFGIPVLLFYKKKEIIPFNITDIDING